jgi:hypothetical protein
MLGLDVQDDSKLLSGFTWPIILKPETKIKIAYGIRKRNSKSFITIRINVKQHFEYTLIFRKQFYFVFRPRHSSSCYSLASHRGGPGSNPGLVMWDL